MQKEEHKKSQKEREEVRGVDPFLDNTYIFKKENSSVKL